MSIKELSNNLSKKQKVGLIAGAVVLVAVVIASIVMAVFSNGPVARIQNIDEYLVGATNEEKYALERALYVFLENAGVTEIGELIVEIRVSTFVETEADGYHMVDFIIDIDKIKMSYTVSYVYPSEGYTNENPVFDCPAVRDTIYPGADCIGMNNTGREMLLLSENPISGVLPISVDTYSVSSRQSIKYDIFGVVDEDEFVVRIIDYSGYSYERALAAIRDKGFLPEDYKIEYIDYSDE